MKEGNKIEEISGDHMKHVALNEQEGEGGR